MNRLLCLIVILLVAAPTRAQEAPAGLQKPGITQIIVQRTWCYGACPIDRLVLNADGSAQYTGEKSTIRLGHFSGALGKEEFVRLAGWIERAGFFDMSSELGQANIDASDLILTIKRGGLFRTVVAHRLGESSLAWAMETMARGVASDIAWRKDEAASAGGIRGSVRRALNEEDRKRLAPDQQKLQGFPASYAQVVASPISDYSKWIVCVADQSGNFSLSLPPGRYHISASLQRNHSTGLFELPGLWLAESQTVEVKAGAFSSAILLFQDKTPDSTKPKPR